MDAITGKSVDVRCLDDRMSGDTDAVAAPLVGGDQKYVEHETRPERNLTIPPCLGAIVPVAETHCPDDMLWCGAVRDLS
jgi:hypothetical protein